MDATLLLYQLLPLLVYIIVDTLVNKPAFSIISAIAISFLQFGFEYFRSGQLDYFIFLDVALITILGGISIILKNEFLFKIKPAVIEGVCVIFLIVMLFMSNDWLINYFNHYSLGITINDQVLPYLRKSLVITAIYLVFHQLSVIYTARHASKKMWALISGPGLYFIFIPIMMVLLPRDLHKYIAARKVINQ